MTSQSAPRDGFALCDGIARSSSRVRMHVRSWAFALAITGVGATPDVVRAQDSAAALNESAPPPRYREKYRPQYHFTPSTNWMNDPNGLVYFDTEYHLFYQYNPFGNVWGHMSWGHAVSGDLTHWRHLPVAIPELGPEMVFSGSVVVDSNNTSGFGRAGAPPMVAIYTAFRSDKKGQAQAIAFSTDRGRTWKRYAGNPVLDIGLTDFRDPKVLWYAPQKKWVLVVALPLEHKVLLYSSSDLKRWIKMSEFGPAGATGGVWECPDLFELPVDGQPGVTRWVLIASINPGGAVGGSSTQYFVGRFDGTRFTADPTRAPNDSPSWADYGKDFYAAVSYSAMPPGDKRRVWIGWMSNWDYANAVPTTPWRSAQSIPRALSLRATPNGYRLAQRPVIELEQLRGTRRHLAARDIAVGNSPIASGGAADRAVEIVANIDLRAAAEAGLKVRTGINEETIIGIDAKRSIAFIDRTRSGDMSFNPKFTGRHEAPITIEGGRVRLRLFVDWSSVELFVNDGQVSITDLIFPSPTSDGIALYSKGGPAHLVSGDLWPLTSIWKATLAPGTRRLSSTAR